MKKMKISGEQYVHCPEFRAIRLERYKSSYSGLYADGISICGIFCFQSKDGSRQSLVHANRFTRIETLIDEANWIGAGGRCTVYTKNKKTLNPSTGEYFIIGVAFIAEMTEKSGCRYEVQVLDQEVIALLLKSDGTVLFFKTIEHDLDIIYHPNFPQLECVYKLNENLAYRKLLELKQVTLLFDGETWQTLKEHDLKLHPVACGLLAMMDARPSDGFRTILIKLKMFAGSWMQSRNNLFYVDDTNLLALATNSSAAVSLVPFIQQYKSDNNAEHQFKLNVTEELYAQMPMTNQDHELENLLRRAFDSKDPVAKVSEVFEQCNYQSEYRAKLHGIIMGFNGFRFHYQRAQLGTWITVDASNQSESHHDTEATQPPL